MPQPLYALWERPQYSLMEVQWTRKLVWTLWRKESWFLCCLAHSLVTEISHALPLLKCSVYCQEHNFQNCTFSLWSVSTKNLIQPHIFQWCDCNPTVFNEAGPQQHLSWFLFCAVQKCTAVLCFNSSFSVGFQSLFLKATFVLQTKRSA